MANTDKATTAVTDIVVLHEQSLAMLDTIRLKLQEVMAAHGDSVDMKLMLATLDDLMAGRFTSGDLAAVYAYRLCRLRGQHG